MVSVIWWNNSPYKTVIACFGVFMFNYNVAAVWQLALCYLRENDQSVTQL